MTLLGVAFKPHLAGPFFRLEKIFAYILLCADFCYMVRVQKYT